MESLRSLPRHIAIAAVALAVAVGLTELLALALELIAPSATGLASSGAAEGVLLVSPLILVFYAGPLIGMLTRKGIVAWPLGGFFGILPGLVLGSLAGYLAYALLVGLFAGLASVALTRPRVAQSPASNRG